MCCRITLPSPAPDVQTFPPQTKVFTSTEAVHSLIVAGAPSFRSLIAIGWGIRAKARTAVRLRLPVLPNPKSRIISTKAVHTLTANNAAESPRISPSAQPVVGAPSFRSLIAIGWGIRAKARTAVRLRLHLFSPIQKTPSFRPKLFTLSPRTTQRKAPHLAVSPSQKPNPLPPSITQKNRPQKTCQPPKPQIPLHHKALRVAH
ncbi:hypothetical protein HDF08_001381 [Edaphobacter lichenicola]|uniref:Uncharacterized protein n=1 Tax=Tunturiibacter lichenicola TaxID=2051959 RepID=A0A852VFU3_9BACT|nr:hypothetical protein [Edaphobacter lichenicola]